MNEGKNKQWVKVATLSDVKPGTCKQVEINNNAIAIANVAGEIYAVDDTCTHAEASLCDGGFDGEELECPLHFAKFNVKTGKALCAPATEDLKTYQVRINNIDIEILLDL